MMECLAMGRYAIITQAVGDQERGNLPYMLKHMAGGCSYQPTAEGVVETIRRLADTGTAEIQQALIRGDGAFQIAKFVIEEDYSIHAKMGCAPSSTVENKPTSQIFDHS